MTDQHSPGWVSPDGQWQWNPADQRWGPYVGLGGERLGHLPGEPPRQPHRGRRNLVLSVALVVAVLVAVGVVLATRNGSGGGSGGGNADGETDAQTSQITDRPTACQTELGSLLDLYQQGSVSNLLTITGTSHPLFNMTQQVSVQYSQDRSTYGDSEARQRVQPVIDKTCAAGGNPLLSREQVSDLSARLAPSPDSDSLDRISVFS